MTTQPFARVKLTKPSDRELVITREFDAPRRLVFEAMTRPEHVRYWYGPRYLKIVTCQIDLRPGGTWRYVLQAPDGSEHGFTGVYREVVPNERIVSTEGYEGMPGHDYLATICLHEHDGKTTVTNTLLYQTTEDREGHLASGMEPGMAETFDRLDELLDVIPREIVTTRIFNASRELVWQVWTDPKHVAQWWGPNGFTNTIHEMDVRPGGVWRFIMHGPDGTDYPNRIVYTEIIKPERIIFDHGDDVDGKPADFHSTVTFEALGNGDETRVTLRVIFATVAERNKAVTDFGAVEGGQQTFNRLGDYLQRLAVKSLNA